MIINNGNSKLSLFRTTILLQAIVVFLLLFQEINASGIALKDIDISKYPLVKAKVYPFDNNGNRVNNLSKEDFSLNENGQPTEIINYRCSPEKEKKHFSAVLTFDVSTSMKGSRLDLAKEAGKAWCSILPPDSSYTAITSFNDTVSLMLDFSNDKDLLTRSIDLLYSSGGTSFNSALLEKSFGALHLLSKREEKRIVVLLTDGESDAYEEQIIAEALKYNISVYSVVIGSSAPNVLKSIAERTGGKCFDKIQDLNHIRSVYTQIQKIASEVEFCEIEWISSACESEIDLSLFGNFSNNGAFDSYQVPESRRTKLLFSPTDKLVYDVIDKGDKQSKSIEIQSINGTITIDTILQPLKYFSIIGFEQLVFPIVLNHDSSIEFTIEYDAKDLLYAYGEFKFETNLCTNPILYCYGGNRDSVGFIQKLQLLKPNGGELLPILTDTIIDWAGVAPMDSVRIEYSFNAANWKLISKSATNNPFRWTVPDEANDNYIMRIQRFTGSDNYSKVKVFQDGTDPIKFISIASDGRIAVNSGSSVKIRDANGALIKTIANDHALINKLEWDPSATFLSRMGEYDNILVWNTLNDTDVKGYGINGKFVKNGAWSRNGKYLIGATIDGYYALWDFPNATPLAKFKISSTEITSISITTDGSIFASASKDGTLRVYNSTDASEIALLDVYSSEVKSLHFASNSNYLLVALANGEVEYWDVSLQDVANRKTFSPNARKAKMSFDDKYYAVLHGTALSVIETNKHQNIYTYSPKGEITDFSWSPVENKIFCGLKNGEIHSFLISDLPFEKKLVSEDVSDGLWEIVAPSFEQNVFDFSDVEIDNYKDSLSISIFKNISKLAFDIDSAKIIGPDAKSFNIRDINLDEQIQVGQSPTIELRFEPTSIGQKQASIAIFSKGRKFESLLKGNSINKQIEILSSSYDVGKCNLDDTLSKSIEIFQNISENELRIDSITIVSAYDEIFDIESTYPIFVNPSEKVRLNLKFTPKNLERYGAMVLVYTNSRREPVYVSLSGEGVAPFFEIDTVYQLSYLKCLLDSNRLELLIKNIGSGYLDVKDISFEPELPSLSFNSELLDNIVPSDSSFILYLKLETDSFVSDSTIVTISHNTDKNLNRQTKFKLRVLADTSTISVNPHLLTFSAIEENQSVERELIVANHSLYSYNINLQITNPKFEVINFSKNPIPANDTSKIRISFLGGKSDSLYVSEIILTDTCNLAHTVVLRADVGIGKADLSASSTAIILADKCELMPKKHLFPIKNIGKKALLISRISFVNSDVFAINGLNSNILVPPDSTYTFEILFNPPKPGEYTSKMIIESNSFGKELFEVECLASFNSYHLTIPNGNLLFDTLRENISQLKTIQVYNTGTLPFEINVPGERDKFTLISAVPTIINPDGSSLLTVLFKGGISGEDYFDEIVLKDSCDNKYIINVSAFVRGFADMMISIADTSSAAGDTLELPIALRFNEIDPNTIQKISTQLSFNPSLLFPLPPTPIGVVESGRRIINIDIEPNYFESDNFKKVKFLVMLGDSIGTEVKPISTNAISSVKYVVEEKSGMFRLDSVCFSGGPRLIDDTGILELLPCYPNPADKSTIIKFGIIENARHKLLLYDNLGYLVRVLADEEMKAGTYEYALSTEALPIGTYMYVLETPSGKILKKFVVLR